MPPVGIPAFFPPAGAGIDYYSSCLHCLSALLVWPSGVPTTYLLFIPPSSPCHHAFCNPTAWHGWHYAWLSSPHPPAYTCLPATHPTYLSPSKCLSGKDSHATTYSLSPPSVLLPSTCNRCGYSLVLFHSYICMASVACGDIVEQVQQYVHSLPLYALQMVRIRFCSLLL